MPQPSFTHPTLAPLECAPLSSAPPQAIHIIYRTSNSSHPHPKYLLSFKTNLTFHYTNTYSVSIAEIVMSREQALQNEIVSGEIVNTSPWPLRDVELLFQHRWH